MTRRYSSLTRATATTPMRSVVVELPESVLCDLASWAGRNRSTVHEILSAAALARHSEIAGAAPAKRTA